MNDNAQIFENATRVVIKGIYYPENHVGTGDWFSFAGKTYANFDDLKVAYNASDVGPNRRPPARPCTLAYDLTRISIVM